MIEDHLGRFKLDIQWILNVRKRSTTIVKVGWVMMVGVKPRHLCAFVF